jgi:hypothetical protein
LLLLLFFKDAEGFAREILANFFVNDTCSEMSKVKPDAKSFLSKIVNPFGTPMG